MSTAVELHSGEYVERYAQKSLRRVRKLADLMTVPDGAELADFACGNGMLLQVLGSRKGTYHGVDFSADFICAAESWARSSHLKNWRFHCSDIVAFCEANPRRFEVGAALDFSEHVLDKDAIAIFDAVRKSLRPGATLYLHTPNRSFFMEALKERGVLKQFPEHIAVRTAEEMRQLLMDAGFSPDGIHIQTIAHYNVLSILHPFRRLPLIGRFFGARLWISARA